MGYLPKKTLEDLEFFEVTEQISDFAITPMGKASCIALEPMADRDTMLKELHSVSEYLASFDNDNRIPNHGFEDLSPAFKLLKIENSVLTVWEAAAIFLKAVISNTLFSIFSNCKAGERSSNP